MIPEENFIFKGTLFLTIFVIFNCKNLMRQEKRAADKVPKCVWLKNYFNLFSVHIQLSLRF